MCRVVDVLWSLTLLPKMHPCLLVVSVLCSPHVQTAGVQQRGFANLKLSTLTVGWWRWGWDGVGMRVEVCLSSGCGAGVGSAESGFFDWVRCAEGDCQR
jgi:hypothetical protein